MEVKSLEKVLLLVLSNSLKFFHAKTDEKKRRKGRWRKANVREEGMIREKSERQVVVCLVSISVLFRPLRMLMMMQKDKWRGRGSCFSKEIVVVKLTGKRQRKKSRKAIKRTGRGVKEKKHQRNPSRNNNDSCSISVELVSTRGSHGLLICIFSLSSWGLVT